MSKPKTLIEFYKDVVDTIGLGVTEDGFIYHGSPDDKELAMKDGKCIVLPTKEHINTVLDKDENGKIVSTKILFNPLKENVVKGNSISLTKVKETIEWRLSHSIACLGELLLTLISKPNFQKKTSLEINNFFSTISEAKEQGLIDSAVKELVDEKSINHWSTIYAKSISSGNPLVTIFLKKVGTVNNVKFNRTAVLKCDTYEELLKADDKTPIAGIKLRKKELVLLRILFEYVIPGIENEPYTVVVGSNDPESPAFISLFTLYLNMMERIDSLITELKQINQEAADGGFVELKVDKTELANINIYKSDIVAIPDESDLTRQSNIASVSANIQQQQANGLNQTSNIAGIKPQIPVNQPMSMQQQAVTEETDPVRKILNQMGGPAMVITKDQMRTPNQNFPSLAPGLPGVGAIPVQATNTEPLMGMGATGMVAAGMQPILPQQTMGVGGMYNVPNQIYQQPVYNNGMYNNQYMPQPGLIGMPNYFGR